MKKSLLCLVVVILTSSACGNPPLVAPETDVLPTQVTSTPPIATPSTIREKTLEPSPTSANSGQVEYSAEKISLAPVDLKLDLPGLSAQDITSNKLKIGIKNWSNKGQKLTFVIPSPEVLIDSTAPKGYDNKYTTSELWIADSDGSNPQKIAEQTGGLVLWSPDDTRLAYEKQIGIFSREIWVTDLETHTAKKLDEPSGIDINNIDYYGSVDWLDNQQLLYLTYSKSGQYPTIRRHLWLHNVQSEQIQEVLVDEISDRSLVNFDLSPNKKFMVGDDLNSLWSGKLTEQNNQLKIDYIKDLISQSGLIPYWSPDSNKIAIKSYDWAENILRIVEINSNNIVEIPFDSKVAHVEWSPDSRILMVSNEASGNPVAEIYVVNVDGSNLKLLSSSNSNYFQWSPTGHYVVIKPTRDSPSGNIFNIFKVEINQ